MGGPQGLRLARRMVALFTTLLASLVLLQFSASAARAADTQRQPNVIFILADDKCYEAMRISHEPLNHGELHGITLGPSIHAEL